MLLSFLSLSASMTVLRGAEIACETDGERNEKLIELYHTRSISGESGVHCPRSPLLRCISGDSESSECASPKYEVSLISLKFKSEIIKKMVCFCRYYQETT